MATMTAFVLVGTPHPYHGGIDPTHMLRLYENSRPSWVLSELPGVRDSGERPKPEMTPTIWVPTVDSMLEDGLLMLALCIFHPPELVEMAKRVFRCDWQGRVELYSDIDQADLKQLHALARQFMLPGNIILTVLMESHILDQVCRVKDYPWEAEVCTWQYARIRPWGTVDGKLPDGTTVHVSEGNPFSGNAGLAPASAS